VTVLMLAFSLLVAFFTQVGEHSEKADVLFFHSQTQRQLLIERIETLHGEWNTLLDAEEGGEVNQGARAELEQKIRQAGAEIESLDSRSEVLADVLSGQVWRLFTPVFLHFGYLHVIFNMYWLWLLGSLMEVRYRTFRYALFLLVVAAGSNLAQACMAGSSFGGMSGVNYGLFGFIFLHGRFHPNPSFQLDRQTIFYMLVWLVLCFTGALGPIANWAHSAGFLIGAGAGFATAMAAGGAKILRRRAGFKRSIQAARENALHQWVVCGVTERDDCEAEFRVGSDGSEYCMRHLPGDEGN
jgi:membrane associated rhomboid family serine protease